MDFEAVSKMILGQFDKHGVRCAIIGGFALHAAGFQRATMDIDFLVHHQDIPAVKSILTSLGYELKHESPDAANFWGMLNELGNIDFIIAHRTYALAMLDRARPHEIVKGCTVNVVVPEDIIGLKIQALNNDPSRYAQDMADIEWLIKNHRQRLNVDLLREYFGLFNCVDKLEEILGEAGGAQ
ncbi:MAG: nucleotidyltransferase [Candidatus Omnitrophica bacterium]|nr:nucleotidyltransferase [Candidatus Omnitrophota bacterium]